MNLPAFSFLLVLFLTALENPRSQLQSLFLATAAFIVAPLLFYNGNAWEVPLWLIAAGLVALFLFIKNWSEFAWSWGNMGELVQPKYFPASFLLLYALISLYLSSRHLVPLDAPLTRVLPPVAVTATKELFLHFGFPLSLIAIGNLARLRRLRYLLPAGLLLAGSLLHSDGGVFLYSLLLIVILRLFLEYSADREASTDVGISLEALGVASLCILLIPEFVFMNDAYGSGNERMNTIFKIYTFDWMLLHFSGFFLVWRLLSWMKPAPEVFLITKLFQAGVLVVFLLFFAHTVPLRISQAQVVPPKARGLSSLEQEFNGAAGAITAFEALPDGVVIETQGNPYSYTTHVSTLAGKDSFLGWANHVQLLNRAYDEISRRERVTDEFYKSGDCAARSGIMRREKIDYAVAGPLEKSRYSSSVEGGFDCMKIVVDEGSYRIYRVE